METELEEDEKQINDLIAHLDECQHECFRSIMHSLREDGDFVKTENVRILMDCEEICRMSKNFFLRESDYAGNILELCACICEDCAESCRTFFEDQTMLDCANVCDNTARACLSILEIGEDMENKET